MQKYLNKYGQIDLEFEIDSIYDLRRIENEINKLYNNRLVRYINNGVLDYGFLKGLVISKKYNFTNCDAFIYDKSQKINEIRNGNFGICVELSHREVDYLHSIFLHNE